MTCLPLNFDDHKINLKSRIPTASKRQQQKGWGVEAGNLGLVKVKNQGFALVSLDFGFRPYQSMHIPGSSMRFPHWSKCHSKLLAGVCPGAHVPPTRRLSQPRAVDLAIVTHASTSIRTTQTLVQPGCLTLTRPKHSPPLICRHPDSC